MRNCTFFCTPCLFSTPFWSPYPAANVPSNSGNVDAITTSGQFDSLRFKWAGESHDYRLACWEFQASTFVTVGVSSAPVNPCESSSLTKLPECSLESPPVSPGASTAKFAGVSIAAGDWLCSVCVYFLQKKGEKTKEMKCLFPWKIFSHHHRLAQHALCKGFAARQGVDDTATTSLGWWD